MSTPATTKLTYADLEGFPDDRLRREIIDGELFVTPSPVTRHQWAVLVISHELFALMDRHGGVVLTAPADVYFADHTVVEPDVVYVLPEHRERVEDRFTRGAPDLVVEVSSPSTRARDLTRKRDLYEREGVAEYWFVDLDAELVLVHRLTEGRYGEPVSLDATAILRSPLYPGIALSLSDLFGPIGR